jgi:WD40 repeat protein
MGLLKLCHGKADIVDLVLRHYHGASRWDTARFDAAIHCVQYGPAGDVIAAGADDGGIHLVCAQTGAKTLCLKGHR